MFYKAGAIVPYLPLKSLPSLVGVATKQWEFLGFRIIPTIDAGPQQYSTKVYEDDGNSTAYLTDNAFVWTHCNLTKQGATTHVDLLSTGKFYPGFPTSRAYQLRLPNSVPLSQVSLQVDSSQVTAVPFMRYGSVESSRRIPAKSQWYYAFEEDEGIGPVIDLVGVPTSKPVRITIQASAAHATAVSAMQAGLYGTLMRSVYAHANQDIDRSNPDQNSPGPAYLSQLSAVGVALEKLADPGINSPITFAGMVSDVPALLRNATAELKAKFQKGNDRVNFTLALLQ
jgi:hypothetical protein